jgi:hypothetical protein
MSLYCVAQKRFVLDCIAVIYVQLRIMAVSSGRRLVLRNSDYSDVKSIRIPVHGYCSRPICVSG